MFEGVAAAQAAYGAAQQAVQQAQARAQQAEAYLQAAQAAQATVQHVAAQAQGEVVAALAALVSKCLRAVFGPGAYTLDIQLVPRRGRTDVQLQFRDPVGGELLDPLGATGGGVVDVAAFALRVAAVLLHRPPARRLLVLDEPFKFLSEHLRPAARQLLVTLAEELEFQFIIVTHLPELVLPGSVELPGKLALEEAVPESEQTAE